MPFRQATTTKIDGMSSPGRGAVIAPPTGGSVDAQIERSTYIIASRLGCTPSTIQRLAGLDPTPTAHSARGILPPPPNSGRRGGGAAVSGRRGAPVVPTPNTTPRQHQHQQSHNSISATTSPQQHPVGGAVPSPPRGTKQHIEGALTLPALPPSAVHTVQTTSNKNKMMIEQQQQQQTGVPDSSGAGGLTIAQQQAAFLDDAEAARQFAAQLRFREAMISQRKQPGVGQYEVPAITGADRGSIYSRSPHVSLDGQTPRSGRFVFNVDLFENGVKRPGPGEYFGTGSSARYHHTVAGRDRSMRKKVAVERVNPRMIPDMKEMQKYQQRQQRQSGGGAGGSQVRRSKVATFQETGGAFDDY